MTDTGVRKPYFVHDPENGVDFFATKAEALAVANQAIAEYREQACFDEEWSEDVKNVNVGVITHAARGFGDDENGYDYRITEISSNPAAASSAENVTLLTKSEIDEIIVAGSFHNAAGGIYAHCVYDFAEALQAALSERSKKARYFDGGQSGKPLL